MEEVFAKLEGLRASLSRNAFCSRAYSAGVRLAKQKGKSVEDCKAFGRKQLAKASKLYDGLKAAQTVDLKSLAKPESTLQSRAPAYKAMKKLKPSYPSKYLFEVLWM